MQGWVRGKTATVKANQLTMTFVATPAAAEAAEPAALPAKAWLLKYGAAGAAVAGARCVLRDSVSGMPVPALQAVVQHVGPGAAAGAGVGAGAESSDTAPVPSAATRVQPKPIRPPPMGKLLPHRSADVLLANAASGVAVVHRLQLVESLALLGRRAQAQRDCGSAGPPRPRCRRLPTHQHRATSTSSGSFFDDPAADGHGLRLAVLLTQRHCEQDDCWQAHRALDAKGDFNGTILAEPSRFPSGLKGIADYIHNKKLFFGICGHKRLASSDDGCRACPFAGA